MKTLRRASLLLALTLLVLSACAGAAAAAQPTVSGAVTDAVSGKGVGGVTVRAYSQDTPGFSWATDTARNGSWTMTLWAGSWKIRYDRHLYVTQWYVDASDEASADALTLGETAVTGIDVALARTPQGHLQGTVTDGKTGLPVADSDVEATSTNGDYDLYGHTLTEADGTYDLAMPPGTYKVRYGKFGYADRWYHAQTTSETATPLTVTDGMLVRGEDVLLQRTPVAIAGTVKDVDYHDLQGVAVQVLDPVDGHVLASATTGTDGYYRLDLGDFVGQPVKIRSHDLAGHLQDRYRLLNGSSTTDPAKAEVLDVKLGISHQWDLWLSAAQHGHVAGHTYNSAGQVVPNVAVRLDRPGTVKETVSDATGAYDIELEVGTATTVTMTFTPPYGSNYAAEVYDHKLVGQPGDPVVVAPGQTVAIDSALTRPCSICGTVTGSGGTRFTWVQASLYDQAGDLAAETLGFDGDYSFTGLREGTYRVFIPGGPDYRDQYYSGAGTLAAATPITVDSAHPDYLTADLAMVPTGTVRVSVYAEASGNSPIAGATVRLYDAAGAQVATATSDSGGGAGFGRLDMGTYYVRCDDVDARYLGEFSGGATELAAAEPVVVSDDAPVGWVSFQLVSRRGTPAFGLALPDGGWNDSTSLVATPTSVVADEGLAVAGDAWSRSARVFARGDGGWTFAARLKPTATGDGTFGRHLAVSGDTVAVSDYNEGGENRDGAGKVWIYRRTGPDWALEQVLKPSGAAYRSFGAALALDGDTLLVGAPDVTIGDDRQAGAVYVYTRSGSTWTQRDKLTCADVSTDAAFGRSVALQGSTAVIAAPRMDWGGHNCGGEVLVFTGGGASWRQRAAIKPSDGLFVLDFGEVVAFDAGTVAIGCSSSPETGAVYVYTGAGASWSQQTRLTPGDGEIGWEMGTDLALHGDTILTVAATNFDAAGGYAAGTGYVFRRTGSAWHQDAELRLPYHGERHWAMSRSVAISDGDLLVGAPSEPRGATNEYGWLHVFHPYVTGLHQTLAVPAGDGVLVNDSSPAGDSLAATLATGPTHGTLDLHADGSFTYTPAQDWAGDDTFTYTASDGTWTSDVTTVTVTTRDPNAPNVSAQDVPTGWVDTPVTVTLSASDDTKVREIDYRRHRAKPVAWTTYDKPFTVTAQGATAYQLRALDVFGNASRTGTVTVKVDTRLPVPKVPKPCTVVRGRTAAIQYLIADPRPGSPTANVQIRVLRSGKEKTNFMLPGRAVGKLLTHRFRCTLPRGRYTLLITAIDTAGNAAARPAKSTLTVR